MVLWRSPSDRPDLGGLEDDRCPVEDLPNAEFVVPGVYPNVCLGMTIRNLAVNSVIHSVVVNELKGSGGTTAFDSVSKTINEYTEEGGQRDLTLGGSSVSSHTFSILKNMVKTWITSGVGLARAPLTCTTPASTGLFMPSCAKTFLQLLAELKRLGSQVIYGDLSRILLATTSKPPGTAHTYAIYINLTRIIPTCISTHRAIL
ncbi:hypothetical protein E1B28_013848 [Marasmius oreades]|uniref:DNA polymerase epsilon catalytic subunit n=1 Tax=Marasmius oreades TaxID=181124 RepID=A0A9P7UJP2_9AGAR|nr:uncharacterized protein E1B28_013848 [Marasmius oreades]KAG7085308.1 hypothetical protein E1B28_013848 [Marasmius oreades]